MDDFDKLLPGLYRTNDGFANSLFFDALDKIAGDRIVDISIEQGKTDCADSFR